MPIVPVIAALRVHMSETGMGTTGHQDCVPEVPAAGGTRMQEKSGCQQQEKRL